MQKITLALLAVILLLSLAGRAFAFTPVVQHEYSAEANSGVRHEVCTSLEGTSVDTYYTGQYTFDILSNQSGDDLLQTLRTLMTQTHTRHSTYNDCRDMAVKTDCENGDGTTINLIYTSYVATMADYINNVTNGGGWNREHVWPTSLGGFNKDKVPGCDLHHIRPSDKSVNGKRGNEKYGVVTNGQPVNGTVTVGNALGGHSNNTYFEPLDNVKGDVARICMYMYVRYGGEYAGCKSITTVFQSIDVLLQWHEMDPVDTWEMGRNEVVYAFQGNRNVFIDYPELVWLVFDREIPQDIATPSGSTCSHKNVDVLDASAASCGVDGYTGITICIDCGKLLDPGQTIPASGEHSYSDWTVKHPAAETTDGILARVCSVCLLEEHQTIPSWNSCKHEMEGVSNEDGTQLTCKICGFSYWKADEVPGTSIPNTIGAADKTDTVVIVIVVVAVVVIAGGIVFVLLRKKKH